MVVYPFFELDRLITKNELFEVSIKLFSDSLKMKRLLSALNLFHTHSKVFERESIEHKFNAFLGQID